MSIGSSIEWTEATWNPVAGCTPVSPGCLNCYAARMAMRLGSMPGKTGDKYRGTAEKSRAGLPVFNGHISLDYEALKTPLSWKLPRIIFVNSMSDLFHKNVPLKFIQQVFDVMERCPQHTFQVLTKRPEVALEYADKLNWAKNIWMGTSVESKGYYERIRLLQKIPAKVRFLSCEPLLGPLPRMPLKDIHWVIVGGESGPGSRPMQGSWVLQIKEQCEAKDVPCFFKQWGGVRKKEHGRELDGQTWDEMPYAATI